MKSVWKDSVKLNEFNSFKGEKSVDVLIIGGGLAGVLCAYFLQRAGADYMLIEGNKIGCGITVNTTAKITAQHSLIYDRLIDQFGFERAQQYLKANLWALSEYESLCKDIDCDFEQLPSFVYSKSDGDAIEKEVNAVNNLGFKAQFQSQIPFDFKNAGAIRFDSQAQFNPLKFLNHISKGLNIFEDTFAQRIVGMTCHCKNAVIKAKNIIIATHFPIFNFHGLYPFKMYQSRSYVIAAENTPNVNGMYVDEKGEGFSFRNYKNLLLVGGGDHRTGKQSGGFNEVDNFIKLNYKQAENKYLWATQDCITLDKVPYIGQCALTKPDIYVATGFNKWGMTTSMVSAKILSDFILNGESEWSDVFSPQRSIFTKQLAVNISEAASGLISFKKRRCPHMGCVLKWNKNEKTWDCPCHGSRFSKDGELINNPAKRNIK
ncbi:MAG: FAD-dependent oxidoreductase [Clostridia bacterium]|nr:FAD-dependent oxidoreductase [Clostridia bacterium]